MEKVGLTACRCRAASWKIRRSHLITLLILLSALAVPLGSRAATEQTNASGAKVAAAVQPFVDKHILAGAVLLWADQDSVLGLECVGFSDVEKRVPMKPDDLFWIASMSKPLTATAFMILVDEGKVKLSDPVEKYLPEFRGQWLAAEQDEQHQLLKKPARPITVEDVLSHTSGLPFNSPLEPKVDINPLSRATVTYGFSPLKTEPGTKYEYSNAGINTAARIIEVASGMPYEKFMEERLFRPLGMVDTTCTPTAKQLERLAKSYKPNAAKDGLEETPINQLTYPLDATNRFASAAGGYFSTAKDLSLFCRMILNGGVYHGKRYLSEAALAEMTSSHTKDLMGKKGSAYGLGWQISGRAPNATDTQHSGTVGHGGAYNTNMQIDLQHQLITIFLVQHAAYPSKEGANIFPAFRGAALEAARR
jgi:CubicO group peptidase (beta-lactamase class C family)